MREALLYEKHDDGTIRCGVCPHRCVVAPGKRGVCGVRANLDGVFYALNDGLCAAAAVDPIEKKPLYHFLPGTRVYSFSTVGCNLRCAWCQNWEISQDPKPNRPVIGEAVMPAEHVARAVAARCPALACTYNEPTVFLEYALDTMRLARAAGLKTVWVTNGFITPEALALVLPLLDAANVDLKGPDDAVYGPFCGGSVDPVLDTIDAMLRAGVHVEVTTLVVPGTNDRPAQLEAVARTIVGRFGPDVPWHVSRFFPAWRMSATPPTPLATLRLAEAYGRAAGIRHLHLGNV